MLRTSELHKDSDDSACNILIIYSGIVECNEPIGILAKKLGLWKVSKDGKTAHTTFEKISYNGSTSVVRCMQIFPYLGLL